MSEAVRRIDATPMGASAIREIGIMEYDATGEAVLDYVEVFQRYARKETNYPLWSVTLNGRPLKVLVFHSDDLWFAENETFNIAGHGATVAQALEDAVASARYLAQELSQEADESLTDHARSLKQKYAAICIA